MKKTIKTARHNVAVFFLWIAHKIEPEWITKLTTMISNTQICVPCGRNFTSSESGVWVFEMFHEEKEIYKIWKADLRECPDCGARILAGMPGRPFMEHYQEGFTELVEKIRNSEDRIFYWYERSKKTE